MFQTSSDLIERNVRRGTVTLQRLGSKKCFKKTLGYEKLIKKKKRFLLIDVRHAVMIPIFVVDFRRKELLYPF
jgi:hypothetical protein